MNAFAKKIAKLFKPLKPRDRVLGRRIVMRMVKNCLSGDFKSAGQVTNDLINYANPKAVDWNAILAFIQGLQPIIESLMAMCQE